MLGARGRRSEQLDNVDMLQDLQWPKLKRRARVDICKADIKKKKYDDAGSKKRVLSVVFSEGKAAIEDIVKQADEEAEASLSQLQRSNEILSSNESGGDDVDTLRTRLASALEANKELQGRLDSSRVGTRLLLACNKALRGKAEELQLVVRNEKEKNKKLHEKLSCLQTKVNYSVHQEQSLKDELANKVTDLSRQKSKWVNLLTRLNKEESETLLVYVDTFHLHDQNDIFFIKCFLQ